MTADRYVCGDERRRALLAGAGAPPNVSGIDYIEVTTGATTADPVFIDIFLVKPLPLPLGALDGGQIALTGGVRFAAPKVDPVVAAAPGGASVARYRVTIPGGQLTDFSTYHLALVATPGASAPPSFIDPRLAAVDFSFKISCPSDFDCAPACDTSDQALGPAPVFDYRVRDYQGFRRQMLDRMAELVPGFKEDDPVDLTTTLIETLAYRSDQQSYRLDWVGTEAFLGTARSRASVARHARLVDYAPGEGASARVFARFVFTAGGGIADGMPLAASTPLLLEIEGQLPVVTVPDYKRILALGPTVFETMAPLTLRQWQNHIAIHTWSDDECCLPRGSTSATLADGSGGGAGALAAGDFLLLIEIASPDTGDPADARPERRQIVRLTSVTPVTDVLAPGLPLVTVAWSDEDALAFDLVVQARLTGALGASATTVCAEAAGNVVLADHGASFPPAPVLGLTPAETEALRPKLVPPMPVDDAPWRPKLDRADVARLPPGDLTSSASLSAAALAQVDPAACLPAVALDDDFAPWTARRDLLDSGRFSRDFVVETAMDGSAVFRFGDDVNGLAPATGTVLIPRGRFGFGPGGNLGHGALAHVVLPVPQQGATLVVSNPLPAQGGAAAESIPAIRIAAPEAFRVQERAVTADDYAAAAMRHPAVANALAIPRFTGAWQTMLVFVDRVGGAPLDGAFAAELGEHLEHFRLMGFDVALRAAEAAPLDIELLVCAAAGEIRAVVAARVRAALRPFGPLDGTPGFFHPDNFTFGMPLYLSKLVAAVMAVPGVQSVTPQRFQRYGRVAQGELAAGLIRPTGPEVLQLADDPSFPERGRLSLIMGGGQ